MHDVELLEQLGYCPGIENYSRYLTGLPAGHPPPTLIDYFPPDFVTIIDESHITVPQIGSMFRGDRARKSNLVEYGFRLPAALDNRPLNFEEFLARTPTILHVSATPGVFERNAAGPNYSEQVIRPTGLVDPQIEVRPAANQVDDLYSEILATVKEKGRVLVTTLTKRMAEDLTSYYSDLGMKVRYLHSDIDSIQRVELLRDLRLGAYDVLVGINLLREGLDLPEVRLVAVMDADKEGFLRSKSSLIQTVGRASRNVQGRVLFYGDRMTDSMRACIDETDRRRAIQVAYNKERGIEPQSILKKMLPGLRELYGLSDDNDSKASKPKTRLLKDLKIKSTEDLDKVIRKKTQEMKKAASALNFEKAAEIRDTIAALRDLYLSFGPDEGAPEV
jgi:excinuclease ABC subunit B